MLQVLCKLVYLAKWYDTKGCGTKEQKKRNQDNFFFSLVSLFL